jgi:hypothetical protein
MTPLTRLTLLRFFRGRENARPHHNAYPAAPCSQGTSERILSDACSPRFPGEVAIDGQRSIRTSQDARRRSPTPIGRGCASSRLLDFAGTKAAVRVSVVSPN